MNLPLERKPVYQHCLETEKHQFVETNKATVESVKAIITEVEDLILTGTYKDKLPLPCFDFFKKRMPEAHYIKLLRLFVGAPHHHKDIIDLSLYTTEGEINLLLMILYQGETKLYLLSEGGNVSTLTRLAYKLIRTMFDLKHRSYEDVYHKLRRKRNKQDNDFQDHRKPLLMSSGANHA